MPNLKIVKVFILVMFIAIVQTACSVPEPGNSTVTTSPMTAVIPADEVNVIYFHGATR